MITGAQAEDLLEGLVAIPSLSRQEAAASAWLAARMQAFGYDAAYVDEAGNAIGEFGPSDAEKCVVLLGHIDTVPGDIPVRRRESSSGTVLYGRGTVDAKGPLSCFVLSAANADCKRPADVRTIVVGAVEEEAATSKGARAIRDRFNGEAEPIPRYCLIGEPSGAHSINRGYRGRVLVRLSGSQPTAHTAGPGKEIAEFASAYWHWLDNLLSLASRGANRIFDQASPSLREFNTDLWQSSENRVECMIGIRLPIGFNLEELVKASLNWLSDQMSIRKPSDIRVPGPDQPVTFELKGPSMQCRLSFSGVEPAWLTPRRNHLMRGLQGAIRAETGKPARYSVKTGTCDMNVVAPAWKCPVAAYGPGDSLLDHTPQEHVSLTEFHASVRILSRALGTLYSTL